jgi:hypothetical protein
MNELVFIQDNERALTTSLFIAEAFGATHKSIADLAAYYRQFDESRCHFEEKTCVDERGGVLGYYEVDVCGFLFISKHLRETVVSRFIKKAISSAFLLAEAEMRINSQCVNPLTITEESLDDIVRRAGAEYAQVAAERKSRRKTYIMYNPESGLYKIGRAEDIRFRERTLSSHFPEIKTILCVGRDIENSLHQNFKLKRKFGEWFALDEADINEIIEEYGFKPYEPEKGGVT